MKRCIITSILLTFSKLYFWIRILDLPATANQQIKPLMNINKKTLTQLLITTACKVIALINLIIIKYQKMLELSWVPQKCCFVPRLFSAFPPSTASVQKEAKTRSDTLHNHFNFALLTIYTPITQICL